MARFAARRGGVCCQSAARAPQDRAAEKLKKKPGEAGEERHFTSAEETHALNMAALAERARRSRTCRTAPSLTTRRTFGFMQQTYAKLLAACQDPAVLEKNVASFLETRTSAENQTRAEEEFGRWFAESWHLRGLRVRLLGREPAHRYKADGRVRRAKQPAAELHCILTRARRNAFTILHTAVFVLVAVKRLSDL
jgi:hypothetical protein